MSRAPFRGLLAAHTDRRTRLAIVSTYPPRRCGLATFARDLRDALTKVAPDLAVSVCALDAGLGLDYPAEVGTVVRGGEPSAYRAAARALAARGTDAVLIEHEFGIYGGPCGEHVLAMADELRRLHVPYLVTPHTLLSDPPAEQASTLGELCRHAAAVAVLTPSAVRYAVASGIAAPEQLVVTPHGAPTALRTEARSSRTGAPLAAALEACAGRRILSTFGLLGPGKAIENAVMALSTVVGAHPDLTYLVAGATHPEEQRRNGEAYRDSLRGLVSRLGLDEHVVFVDDFLSTTDLAVLLGRTDVYLTPYRSREQISSGTLTFAVAAGRPVVSTDYHYACDVLAGGAGELVPVDDPLAFGSALAGLLGDPARLRRARMAAEAAGTGLLWPAVARQVATVVRGVVGGVMAGATGAAGTGFGGAVTAGAAVGSARRRKSERIAHSPA